MKKLFDIVEKVTERLAKLEKFEKFNQVWKKKQRKEEEKTSELKFEG